MADWVTISSLATAGGTLVLAIATYASVRSANRSARVAELALQEQRRPVLVNSNADDRTQAIPFVDAAAVEVPGGGAVINATPEAVYLVASLRNVGSGLAVLQAWQSTGPIEPQLHDQAVREGAPDVEGFRPLIRDQYIAPGDIGIWQAAIRDTADPLFTEITQAAAGDRTLSVDLLYTDQVGGQRTVSRFGLRPDDGGWFVAAARHWYLDGDAPR